MVSGEKRCIIVGGGDFDAALLPEREPEDLLIAADSGLLALEAMGLRPELCVGDFDSLGYVPEGAEVIRLPVEKDDTDMVAAARQGLSRGYRRFTFLGVLGGDRFSHSLAAVQTLFWLLDQGAEGEILHTGCRIRALGPGRTEYPASAAGSLSLFALNGEAELSLEGLKYSLDHGRLGVFPLGVSNSFTGAPAAVVVHSGAVAAVEEP